MLILFRLDLSAPLFLKSGFTPELFLPRLGALLSLLRFSENELLVTYHKLLEKAKIKSQQQKNIKKEKQHFDDYLANNNLNYYIIQYLYMRSFFNEIAMNNELKSAVSYYQNQTIHYWSEFNLYAKGQIAL